MTNRSRRGFTLFELIAVMALLVLLAVAILPSVGAFRGDTRQRAAADSIRAELAVSRARAMEEGRPYRLSISEDGTRLRRAPEGPEFAQVSAADRPAGSATAVEYPFEYVRAEVVREGEAGPVSDAGWVTVATVLPDGTCREDATLLAIREDERNALYVRVRGVTASSRVLPAGAVPNGGPR